MTNEVLFASTQTKGDAITDMTFIGPATILATLSEELRAIRFGTSSPKTMLRYVTRITMSPWARAPASPGAMPARTRSAANESAIAFPEKIPVRIPISVMPICTAERNLSGSDDRFRAVFAALLPLLASV